MAGILHRTVPEGRARVRGCRHTKAALPPGGTRALRLREGKGRRAPYPPPPEARGDAGGWGQSAARPLREDPERQRPVPRKSIKLLRRCPQPRPSLAEPQAGTPRGPMGLQPPDAARAPRLLRDTGQNPCSGPEPTLHNGLMGSELEISPTK